MPQTPEGAIKIAAEKHGISVEQYKKNLGDGLLWCTDCRTWHPVSDFGRNKSRHTGRAQSCKVSANRKARTKYYKPIPIDARRKMGPLPAPERDGDKKQARARVNALVRMKQIPHPNELPCVDCDHIYKEGEKRHEYDHYEGYATGKHTVVESVCSKCHNKRHPREERKNA